MRKVIGDTLYEDGIVSGSNKASMEREAIRLYPGQKTIVQKGKMGQYYIWKPIGKAPAKQDPTSLALKEFENDLHLFRQAAKDFRNGLPNMIVTSATIYALQLITEYGSKAAVKKAWKLLFSGKIAVAFIETDVGTVGIAYTGKLAKYDKVLIRQFAED